jgi:hypothetical protein
MKAGQVTDALRKKQVAFSNRYWGKSPAQYNIPTPFNIW